MHGGAAGVIFDMSTTTALCPLARPGFWEFLGGVTRSLNISYLKAVPIGTKVRLNSRVIGVGRHVTSMYELHVRHILTSYIYLQADGDDPRRHDEP
jgi:acyl-coenzyme A thioesterase PaaI-like protein